MAVGVANRVVAKKNFHGRKKHKEIFNSNFIPLWNPRGDLLPGNLLNFYDC